MTDEKWRSPNGHSIASDVTDKLPPYTHPENVHTETPNYIHIGDDLLSRIEKMLYVVPDKDGCFKSLHDLGMWISRAEAALIKRALAQQQTVNEELIRLRNNLEKMPSREEFMSGQIYKYLDRLEVLAWVDEAIARAEQKGQNHE